MNDLYKDVCLIQTLHPEMATLFKQYSNELMSLEHRFAENLSTLGYDGPTDEAEEVQRYQKRFCAC